MEIGCGTGQLTQDLARTGATIRCLEPGPSLAERARANLSEYSNVEVLTTTFEGYTEDSHSHQTVVSATAFHWVDPSIAFPKAGAVLEAGGHLALMTHLHSREGTHTSRRFAEEVRALHRRLAPEIGDWTFPATDEIQQKVARSEGIETLWAKIERKFADPPDVSHLFEPAIVKTYPWIATYDRSSYVDMLASHSSYALIEDPRRNELLTGIGRLIDEQLPGGVTKQYVTILAIARRRTT